MRTGPYLDRRSFMGAAASLALTSTALSAQTSKPASDPLAGRFGGPFALTDHNGQRVTDQTWRGQYMLIYFGFTRCIDACPVDVPNLVQGLDLVAPLDARIQPLFVTVDPADTASELKTYVEAFHPRLIGLTGTEAELAAMAKAYRVHRYRVQMQSDAQQPVTTGPRQSIVLPSPVILAHGEKPHAPGQRFSINHGTLTYLMGPDGGFLTIVPHGSDGQRIAGVLRKYVRPA